MSAKIFNNKIFSYFRNNSTEILCVVCFIVTHLYLLLMLFPTDSPIAGHDSAYHYLRVEALKHNIETGNVFSGIDYLYFGGGGYAGFAYPELFLYIPAFLRIMGVGIGESMAVFISLCNALSYCSMYIFLSDISKSNICGTIGAVMYVLSTYRIDNIITRFALGEVIAYVFWPLILYGLYDFIFREFKKPYIIGIGFVGMLLSHSISTALALGLCVVVSLIFAKRIFKAPKRLAVLGLTAGCAVLVTAFYWLPLIEFLLSCEMSVMKSAYNPVDYAIPFVGLFQDVMHNGIAGLRFPIFLLCVPRVFLTRSSPIARKYLRDESTENRKDILVVADTFMIIGLVLTIMTTELVPWDLLHPFLNFMQFPWRFFAPVSILLIFAGTVYIFHIAKFTKAPKTAMVAVTAVALLIAFVHTEISVVYHTEPYEDDHYYSNVNDTYYVGAGEWLPRAANAHGKDIIKAMGETVSLSNGASLPCERDNGTLNFKLSENADYAVLPYIWYKGYEAADENGNALEISMSENGLVQVDLHGASGVITVEHKPTAIKIISAFISLAAALALSAVAVIRQIKSRKSKQQASKNESDL